MTTTADKKPDSEYKVVGTRPIRHDGVDKVTGNARYGADINLPGMLHAKVLRSPHGHARIKSIDTSKAEAHPGVRAVCTAADFPIIEDKVIDFAELQGNPRMMAENVLAHDKALYKGHAIAAVAASSPHDAEEALELIEVEYEVLKPVLSINQALADDAPLLHDDMTTRFRVDRFGRGDDTGTKSNLAGHLQFVRGERGTGLQRGRSDCGEGAGNPDRPPRLHRTPHLNGILVLRRPDNRLDLHPGDLRNTIADRRHSCSARVNGEGHSHGNRRRVRRQAGGLPGPGGCDSISEERQARQNGHEPLGGLRGFRAHLRFPYALQDRRHQVRQDNRRRAGPVLRVWRFPRLARGRRRPDWAGSLQDGQPPGERL